MYTRTLSGVDWAALSNDIMGLLMAVLGCGLITLAIGGFLFVALFGIRMAIKSFKDGEL